MSRTSPSEAPQLPEENLVAIGDDWKEHTLDRRGGGVPRPVHIDPDAPGKLQALFAEAADDMERLIGRIPDADHAAAIRAGAAGEPDPHRAGMALKLLAAARPTQQALIDDLGRDAWITRHGLAFAACATLEELSRSLYWQGETVRVTSNWLYRLVHSTERVDRISPLRSLLAALPQSEYDAAVTAVEAHRDTDEKRFLSAMLMPDQEAWVLEACRLHVGRDYMNRGNDPLWAMASTREHLELSEVRILDRNRCDARQVARLIDGLGAEALPVLVNTLEDQSRPRDEVRGLLFDAIGRLPSDAAIDYLLRHLTNPSATAVLPAAVERFPTRTLRRIAATAPSATGSVRVRLAAMVRSMPPLNEALAAIEDGERMAIEELLRSTERLPVAASVPEAFTAPPWSKFPKRPAKPAVDLVPPTIDELRWAEGERQEWESISDVPDSWTNPWYWAHYQPEYIDRYLFAELLAYGPEEQAREAFDRWDGRVGTLNARPVQAILARYGDEAAARVLELVKQKPSYRAAMLPFVNLEAARTAAVRLTRSREDRAASKAWLDRHAADAAALLIPDALGKAAKARQAAVRALRYLAAADRTMVDARAAEYGEAAAEGVKTLLDTDPLDPGRRAPKTAAWADPAMLPPVLLPGREAALPVEAVTTLMTALALDDPEQPYAGVDVLTAECDPISLTAFSWGLFELWLSVGAPSKDAWAMHQLRRFADDAAVRRLTALILEWPGQGQSRRAVQGLEVLGGVGSEAALRAVRDISRKAKFKALKKAAVEQIEAIAERLELTTEQLADRLVPDFGLDPASALVLDYGPRSFTVGFDERLRPFVVDGKGKRRASPPKAAAADDPGLAGPARERFAALRRDLKTTAAEQVKRLERAMVDGRTWSGSEFRLRLVDHPLMRHLSGRLIWQAETGGVRRSFRIAEDGTFADSDDEEFALPHDAVVRIAHPVTLGEAVAQWVEVLADYEILQPFEQLTRPVLALTDTELATGRLTRFEGAVVGSGPIRGLLRHGWQYGDPRGHRYGYFFAFPGGGHVFFEPDPDVHPGYDSGEEHKLRSVEVGLPEGGIDPVPVSEALAALARLARAA